MRSLKPLLVAILASSLLVSAAPSHSTTPTATGRESGAGTPVHPIPPCFASSQDITDSSGTSKTQVTSALDS